MARKTVEELTARFCELCSYERELNKQGFEKIAGMDEVGRGPLAGPVVAACVVLPNDFFALGIDDSKKLSEKKREELYEIIINNCISYSIGIVNADIIDKINILEATKMAMKEAFTKMPIKPDYLLLDAMELPELGIKQEGIVKGDAKCLSIAAASIVAKVTRDRMMAECDVKYPGYGFAKNKGYGTAMHYKGIDENGIAPIHRRSFLKKYLSEGE